MEGMADRWKVVNFLRIHYRHSTCSMILLELWFIGCNYTNLCDVMAMCAQLLTRVIHVAHVHLLIDRMRCA